jgi:hypothetical protein
MKQLRTARIILFVIGVLTVGVTIVQLTLLKDEAKKLVQKEIAKQGPGFIPDPVKVREAEEQLVRLATLLGAVQIALGIIFIVFGFIVYLFPVPVTIISLVLYVGSYLAFGLLNPETLAMGIVIKIFIVIAMVKAIQAAIAYQKTKDEDFTDDRQARRKSARDRDFEEEEEFAEEEEARPRRRWREEREDEAEAEEPVREAVKATAREPDRQVEEEAPVVACVKCGRKLRVPAAAAGKRIRCPECGEIFQP